MATFLFTFNEYNSRYYETYFRSINNDDIGVNSLFH